MPTSAVEGWAVGRHTNPLATTAGAILLVVGVAAAYALGAELAWQLFGATDIGLAFFPPAGITIAAALLVPPRRWPAIVAAVVIAEVAVDAAHGLAFRTALGYAVANALEPLVSATALRRWQAGEPLDIARRRGMRRFLVCAVGIGPAVASLVGAAVRVEALGGHLLDIALHWWVGDGLAVLALGAPILVLATPRPRTYHLAEAVVSQLVVFVASVLAFTVWSSIPPSVLLLPPLVWAAVRYSVRGVAVASATVAIVANVATAAGHGPFAAIDVGHQNQLQLVQVFLAAILLTGWFLGIERNERELAQSQRELERMMRVRAESVQSIGELSRELVRAETVTQVLDAVKLHLRSRLDVPIVVISLPDRSTGRWTVTPSAVPDDVRQAVDAWDDDCSTPGLTAMRTGSPVWVRSRAELVRRFPDTAAVASIAPAHVIGALPLVGADGVLGFLAVARTEPGAVFDHATRDALVAIAQLVSQAVQRAQSHEAEHRSRLAAEESEQRFRAVADQSPLLVWVQDADGRQEWVNETACRFFGLARDEMMNGAWRPHVVEDAARYRPELAAAIGGEHALHNIVRVRRHDGEVRWLESWAEPRVLADGRFAGHVGTSADVTERVEAEHRLRAAARLESFKSRLLELVRQTTDVGSLLDATTAVLVDELDGVPVRFVPGDRDPTALPRSGATHVEAIVVDDVTISRLVVEPSDGQSLGDEDVAVVREAASRTSLALARVFTDLAQRRRRHAARLGNEILRELELRGAADDALQSIVDALVADLAIDAAVVAVDPDDEHEIVLARAHRAALLRHDARLAPPVSARTLVVPLALAPGRDATLRVTPESSGPLDTSEDDAAHLRELSARAGLVLSAARVRRAEHDIALTLQRALLPDRVHWHPNVVIEARYHAGSDLLEVGGDWYDTFVWDDHRLVVTIGDVVGHNLESAAAMGRLRSAAAALAGVVEQRPGVLLDSLDRFARGPDGTSYATAVCATVDPHDGTLVYSSAGHPPGLVVDPDGTVRRLDRAQSPPLCAFAPRARPEVHERLTPGSVVLFYSDGLIERRGETLDEGLARLEAVLVRHRRRSLGELADVIVEEMTAGIEVKDDIVAVCLRYAPVRARLHVEVDARPPALAGVRRTLREWLAEQGVDPDTARDLLLATGEACTNAVEHAYEPCTPGPLRVEVTHHGSHVVAKVADAGCWRPPDRSRDSHGLTIIRALASHVDHRPGSAGTVVTLCVPTPEREVARVP